MILLIHVTEVHTKCDKSIKLFVLFFYFYFFKYPHVRHKNAIGGEKISPGDNYSLIPL